MPGVHSRGPSGFPGRRIADGHRDVALAVVGGRLCTDPADVIRGSERPDSTGFWAVVIPFEGPPVRARFAEVRPATLAGRPVGQSGPTAWSTSLDRDRFLPGGGHHPGKDPRGDVYQVNLTRRLNAAPAAPRRHHPPTSLRWEPRWPPGTWRRSRPSCACRPRHPRGQRVAGALPVRDGDVLRLAVDRGNGGRRGVAARQDRRERLDRRPGAQRPGDACEWGSVTVPSLLALEQHPGLGAPGQHRRGPDASGAGWATPWPPMFPAPVTGAPKEAALAVIERSSRCRGASTAAVGWVGADRRRGDPERVAIRTFWIGDGWLHLGTGGGITIDSDPGRRVAGDRASRRRNLLRVARGW